MLFLLLAATTLTLAAAPSAGAADARAELMSLLAEAWEFRLEENPLLATRVGDHRADDRLPSVAPGDFERRSAFGRRTLERLGRIDREALSEADRVSYDMFERVVSDELVLRTDGGNSDIGYPWACLTADGRILSVYYLNQGDGTRFIAGTFVDID